MLSKITMSRYVQQQWQSTEAENTRKFVAGGSFSGNNIFQTRRGRIKLTYQDDFSKYVIQPDMTEKSISIKDAYLFRGGAFDRPITKLSSKRRRKSKAVGKRKLNLGISFI